MKLDDKFYTRAARRFCAMMSIDPDATYNGLMTQVEYWTIKLEIDACMECAVGAEMDALPMLPPSEG